VGDNTPCLFWWFLVKEVRNVQKPFVGAAEKTPHVKMKKPREKGGGKPVKNNLGV